MNDAVKASCVLAIAPGLSASMVANAIKLARPEMSDASSLWLWVKGSYRDGSVSTDGQEAVRLLKRDGWVTRNEVIWVCKASDPAPENRLKRTHETVFHMTSGGSYYYDRTIDGAFETMARMRSLESGYARKIDLAPTLTEEEKAKAREAMQAVMAKIAAGEVTDFRMSLRGLHKVDGWLASKVEKDGFHVKVSPRHAPMIGDVWSDWSNETNALLPSGMVARMVALTCPADGSVLDLFPSVFTGMAVMRIGRGYRAWTPAKDITEPVVEIAADQPVDEPVEEQKVEAKHEAEAQELR